MLFHPSWIKLAVWIAFSMFDLSLYFRAMGQAGQVVSYNAELALLFGVLFAWFAGRNWSKLMRRRVEERE